MNGVQTKVKKATTANGKTSAQAAAADQYFTHPDIAKHCLLSLDGLLTTALAHPNDPGTWWIEPSAGGGAFLDPLLLAG